MIGSNGIWRVPGWGLDLNVEQASAVEPAKAAVTLSVKGGAISGDRLANEDR